MKIIFFTFNLSLHLEISQMVNIRQVCNLTCNLKTHVRTPKLSEADKAYLHHTKSGYLLIFAYVAHHIIQGIKPRHHHHCIAYSKCHYECKCLHQYKQGWAKLSHYFEYIFIEWQKLLVLLMDHFYKQRTCLDSSKCRYCAAN